MTQVAAVHSEITISSAFVEADGMFCGDNGVATLNLTLIKAYLQQQQLCNDAENAGDDDCGCGLRDVVVTLLGNRTAACTANRCTNKAAVCAAQDSDGDGVDDINDGCPLDPTVSNWVDLCKLADGTSRQLQDAQSFSTPSVLLSYEVEGLTEFTNLSSFSAAVEEAMLAQALSINVTSVPIIVADVSVSVCLFVFF